MTAWLSTRAARPRLAHTRSRVILLAVAALLAGCEGGSGQSGGAFVFLSVDSIGTGTSAATSTGTINSSIDTGTTTLACATLRNNLKNPTITSSTALDNVVVQSYTVTLTAVSGGALPGPFTFGTAVIVPPSTVAGMTNVLTPGTATFPIILVPAGAKLDPRVRPPNQLPIIATAQVKFRGRDGRGQSVEAEGAATVVFVTGNGETTPACTSAPLADGENGET